MIEINHKIPMKMKRLTVLGMIVALLVILAMFSFLRSDDAQIINQISNATSSERIKLSDGEVFDLELKKVVKNIDTASRQTRSF